MSPTTSVVIPTFNRASLVERAVRSALDQSKAPDEVIVVDDASSDGTAALVEGIDHPAVRLVRHELNRGASAARNTGLDAATGDIVAFLDSDDEWRPERLERQISPVGKAGILACSFEVRTPGRSLRVRPGCFRGSDPHTRLLRLRGGPLTASCLMIDRRAGGDQVRFDPGLDVLEDLDFAIRATRSAALAHVDEVLVIKHSGRSDRLYTPAAELAARYGLLDRHASELAGDGTALGAHHLAIARAATMQDRAASETVVREHLDAAAKAWPSVATRTARAAWRLGGARGLRLVCRGWWFLAEDPVGRVRSVR